MDHECFPFGLVWRPVKVGTVVLGPAEQTGQRLIHYTLFIWANNTSRV